MVFGVPTAYLSEFADELESRFSVVLSQSQISRIFTSHYINRKKLSKEAKQKDPEKRIEWLSKLYNWRADQLVFLDESAVTPNCSNRNHGRAPKGQRIRHKVNAGRAQSYSILPAFTLDGYIACSVYQGGVNGPTFNAWVRDRLLPQCNPFPGT